MLITLAQGCFPCLAEGFAQKTTRKVEGFMLVCPSVATVGESFSIRIKALARPYIVKPGHPQHSTANRSSREAVYMDNVPVSWSGTICIQAEGEGFEGPATFSFPKDMRPIARIEGLRFTMPGVKVVTVLDKQSGARGRGNAIQVHAEKPQLRLYWGDIHNHTIVSDGIRTPEQVCRFARDEGFLDIFAITDHDSLPNERIEKAVQSFYRKGRFVTFFGDELTDGQNGHMNVYYPRKPNPDKAVRRRDGMGTVAARARRTNAMLIRHHTAAKLGRTSWPLGYAPDVMRLIEIYSAWGNSECPKEAGNPRPIRYLGGERSGGHVWDALCRDYRFGFIGSSDGHDGRPGDDLMYLQTAPRLGGYHKLYKGGLLGVWAEALTREAIWDALRNRRVYAATNARIILRFAINGKPMGSEISGSAGKLDLFIEVLSDTAIARVDLVKQCENVKTWTPNETHLTARAEDQLTKGKSAWYYVRVSREDGEMAWSSPIWVDMP